MLILFLAVLGSAIPAVAHESPVDHVSREMRLWWSNGRLHVDYRIVLVERAAMLQLDKMDTDRDGKISDDERRAFFGAFAADLANRFEITIDGQKLKLHSEGSVALDPMLGQTYHFVADEIPLEPGKHAGELMDFYSRSYPGPYRLLPTPTASASSIEVAGGGDAKDAHPGMVIVRFDVNVAPPAK